MFYPTHFENKIDFVSIRNLLKNKCSSSLGVEKVNEIAFSANFQHIHTLLSQTDEMLSVLTTDADELPLGDFFDIREGLARVHVEGLFLDELELFSLWRALEAVRKLVFFFRKKEETAYPYLLQLLPGIDTFPIILKQIEAILNKFGKIKDNASPELARIRREMQQVESSISRTLQAILRQAQADGFVEKDIAPTMRDGRLVIPVSPAFKRKVSGIVHDESATGKTVFIEPQQVVEANNRIRSLEGEERREIMRILIDFTNFLRPHFDEIINSQYFLGTIDFLRAKALFAVEIKAIKPRMDDVCQLEWVKAVHPILFLALQKQHKTIIPLDITLNEKQRILLISGPNAGGKSVCLKTVVLLQYMLQCGLLVPLHDSSRTGVFERLFIDIGDEQSIENDLSTYSSHLLNMKFFIKNSTPKTLLLIDEFGTGTEPIIGGAIAEATLERFQQSGAFGVITTHYSNLKLYADATEGIVNGAMLYDRQHLQPLFQLSIGNPGSSFAVEIARKIGLPEDLIAQAAEKVGSEHMDYDKHLQDIVRDKRYWENKRRDIRVKEKKLEETLLKYEALMASAEKQGKEIIQRASLDAQNLLMNTNAKIENTIREIKESQAEKEKTKLIRKDFEAFKTENDLTLQRSQTLPKPNKPALQLKKTKQNLSNLDANPKLEALQVGDNVRLKGQTAVGVILEMQDKNALVAFGVMKSTVQLSKLEKISHTQLKKEKNKYDEIATTTNDEVRQRKLSFSSEIDVRGMRVDEALQAVTYFVDDALMVGVSSVRILHGTGTGALRMIIRQYLGTVQAVANYRDEHVQFGGAGITIVEFL
ncbi:MAG: endonuclease MutS2 [Porphyromonadaceae bacterium CG2_30_38_12]|nr:MAG: endonuclease MutS2 [Porphyromonadaceae bacterium CG2_30_38_12]